MLAGVADPLSRALCRVQANGEAAPAANGDAAAAPQQAQQAQQADAETETLKRDLAELPPEAPLEAYEAMPVDRFGEALLRCAQGPRGR